MKILLKGYYGFGNLGDDILMVVSYRLLKERYPDSTIAIFSNNSENNKDSKSPNGYNRYIRELIGEIVDIIDWTYKGQFDLLFNGGGGIYFDSKKGPLYYYIINKIIKLTGIDVISRVDTTLRLITNKAHHIKFRRRIGMGIGVGPFHSAAKTLFRNMAELGSYDNLSVRDSDSYCLLNRLKFKQELFQGTDLSFFLDYWITGQTLRHIDRDQNKVGIILKGHTSEIYDHYKKLANKLKAQEFKVEFYSFDRYYDQDYINSFHTEFVINIWHPGKDDLDGYIRNLWTCSICITDRAHGALLGAIGGVIPLIIRTSQKSDQVFDILALESVLPESVYSKLYELDDILRVHNDQENISSMLRKIVQNRKTMINENNNSHNSI